MPLVTLTTSNSVSRQIVDGLLAGVHAALTNAGVPPADRFQRVLQLEPDALRADSNYPDLTTPRTERFVLLEITLSVGRTLKLKRQIARDIIAAAERLELSGEDVMIVFNETRWENWSFAGGRFFYT